MSPILSSTAPIVHLKPCIQSVPLDTLESNHSIGTPSSSEPMPIPPAANMAIVDEPLLAVDSKSTSASTTPVSDTTASDTDQSGLQHQATDQEARMEDTPDTNSA